MTKRKAIVDLRDVAEDDKDTPRVPSVLLEAQDLGHRVGNFHNYYAFHPPSHRLDKMQDILEYIGKRYKKHNSPFEYCDLGCNEGDLTIEIACAVQQELQTKVHFQGVDIDPVLIERASDKCKSIKNDKVTGDFQVGNICENLDKILLDDDSVDMTSLFSTTMWIHVQAGDEGLRKVLEQICRKTKQFLVIEPQPSKWYVYVNVGSRHSIQLFHIFIFLPLSHASKLSQGSDEVAQNGATGN